MYRLYCRAAAAQAEFFEACDQDDVQQAAGPSSSTEAVCRPLENAAHTVTVAVSHFDLDSLWQESNTDDTPVLLSVLGTAAFLGIAAGCSKPACWVFEFQCV